MTTKTEVERLATLEVEMKNLQNGMDMVNSSMKELHGKFDAFSNMITQNYVAKETFEEYKRNRTLERVVTVLVTAIISGLVAFFLRVNKF